MEIGQQIGLALLALLMAVAFYNPRSANRPHTFEQVLQVLRETCMTDLVRIEEITPEFWSRMIAVNLSGAWHLTRAAVPGMRARGFGRIVNIGSIHSLVASPYKSAYIAAKHGLIGLSRTVALENGDVDLTVNTICPAYVRTPLVDQQIARQAAEHGLPEERVINEIMLRPMPKKAFIAIGEIAAAVDYFLSDAAKNVTAQALALDGGWTAQ